MDQVNRGGHFVHILATRSLGGGDHFFHLPGIKGQINFFWFRQHGHGCGGGVDAALGLGGGDAFDLVGPGFKRQMTPASFAVDANNREPKTAGLVGPVVIRLKRPAAALGVRLVHLQQIPGPKSSFVSADSSSDFKDQRSDTIIFGTDQRGQHAIKQDREFIGGRLSLF